MNLLNTLAKVSSVTLISRVFGLARDLLIARIFGADAATDAFYVAFRLPNLLRRIFAEGAFSQAFVPILVEYKGSHSHSDTRRFLGQVTSALGLALVLVTVIGILAAPLIVRVTAPGFAETPDKFATTVTLLRITFPYILLISLASLAGSVLNTYNKFSIAAFTPTLLNLAFIGCILWLQPLMFPAINTLAWAVLLGGILQLAIQLPFLYRLNVLPALRWDWRGSGVGRIVRQMGPAIMAVSMSQISLVINTIFASFLVSGSVSWMYNADRLMEFPTGLLGVGLGVILLPSLSRHYSAKSPQAYSALLDWGLRLCTAVAVPAAAAIACISLPLVSTMFFGGKFQALDVEMTCRALTAYSVGIPALIAIKILAPAFFSRQDVRTPARAALWSLLATQMFNVILLWPIVAPYLHLSAPTGATGLLGAAWGLQHAGLALSISAGAAVNAGILYWQLRRRDLFRPLPGWRKYLLQVFLATAAMSAVLILLAGSREIWLINRSFGGKLLHLVPVIAAGLLVYCGVLWLSGLRLRHFARSEA